MLTAARPHGLYTFRLLVVAALLCTPWLQTPLTDHDQSRLVQLMLTAVASLVLLANWSQSSFTNRQSGLPLALGGLLLALVSVSCLRSADRMAAFQDAALYLGIAGLSLTIALSEAAGPRLGFERGVALSAIVIAGVIAPIYLTAFISGHPLNARQLHLGFDNPRFLNHAQTVFVPWLLLVFPLREERRVWRGLAFAAAVIHIAVVYLDVARGTGLAWCAVAIVLAVYARWRLFGNLLGTLALGLALGVLIADVLPSLSGRAWEVPFATKAGAGSAHSRDRLWLSAWEAIQSAPWLGHGGMSLAADAAARATHPHDIYLQWGAEYGLPATVVAVLLLLAPLYLARRRLVSLQALDANRLVALTAVCAAALTDGLVSGNFVMPYSQLWIALAYGQVIGSLQPAATRSSEVGRRRPWPLAFAICVCCSQVWLLWVSFQQVSLSEPRLHLETPTLRPGEKARPRFWLNGQL